MLGLAYFCRYTFIKQNPLGSALFWAKILFDQMLGKAEIHSCFTSCGLGL